MVAKKKRGKNKFSKKNSRNNNAGQPSWEASSGGPRTVVVDAELLSQIAPRVNKTTRPSKRKQSHGEREGDIDSDDAHDAVQPATAQSKRKVNEDDEGLPDSVLSFHCCANEEDVGGRVQQTLPAALELGLFYTLLHEAVTFQQGQRKHQDDQHGNKQGNNEAVLPRNTSTKTMNYMLALLRAIEIRAYALLSSMSKSQKKQTLQRLAKRGNRTVLLLPISEFKRLSPLLNPSSRFAVVLFAAHTNVATFSTQFKRVLLGMATRSKLGRQNRANETMSSPVLLHQFIQKSFAFAVLLSKKSRGGASKENQAGITLDFRQQQQHSDMGQESRLSPELATLFRKVHSVVVRIMGAQLRNSDSTSPTSNAQTIVRWQNQMTGMLAEHSMMISSTTSTTSDLGGESLLNAKSANDQSTIGSMVRTTGDFTDVAEKMKELRASVVSARGLKSSSANSSHHEENENGREPGRQSAQTRWLDGKGANKVEGADWEGKVRHGTSADSISRAVARTVAAIKSSSQSKINEAETRLSFGRWVADWSINPAGDSHFGGRYGKACGHNEVVMLALRPFEPLEVLNTRICSEAQWAPGNEGFHGCLEFLRLACQAHERELTCWDVDGFHFFDTHGVHSVLPKRMFLSWSLKRVKFLMKQLRRDTVITGGKVLPSTLIENMFFIARVGVAANDAVGDCNNKKTAGLKAALDSSTLPSKAWLLVAKFSLGGDPGKWESVTS